MYATRLVPVVPLGIGGGCSQARRVAMPAPTISIQWGMLLFLLLCLVSGYVIGLCLDRGFEMPQTGYGIEIDNAVELDTSQVTDRRWGGGAFCGNC
jgi:hypothetical protein